MKTVLPFLLALALWPTTPIQAQWQVIDPQLPDSLDFIAWGISVVDENIVWGNPLRNVAPAQVPQWYFYKTTDGGQSWTYGEIEEATPGWWWTHGLVAVDSNTAWVVRVEGGDIDNGQQDSSEVLKTTDGGDVWLRQNLPYTHPTGLVGIHFFNKNEGAAWGEAHVSSSGLYPNGWQLVAFYTQDGGDTWHPALMPLSTNEGIYLASGKSAGGSFERLGNNIWFGTTQSRVFRSNDRGKTWNASAPLLPGRVIDNVSFRDSLNGIAFSTIDNTPDLAPKLAFHTDDGGQTWTPLPASNTTWFGWLTDVECVPGSGGVYWGISQTQTVVSKDNGNTWVHENTPFLLWFTEFLSPKVGWGAGAVHPTPPTSKLLMYKWIGDSLLRDERLNATKTWAGAGIEGRLDGDAGTGRFWNPKGMAMATDNSGAVYVADDYNHCIRKIALDGQVSTLAGTGTPGYVNGPGASAQFNRPQDLVLDSAGNLYVADANNFVVRKITSDGTVSLFAGIPGQSGETNGPALQATFGWPAALAIDGAGNLFVSGSLTIRKIAPSGMVSTVHGALGYISGIDADRFGTIYFADYATLSVQKLSPDGQVSFLAGGGQGCTDGVGAAAKFGTPDDLAADDFGNVYVADGLNARIRKIDAAGNVITLTGSDCLNNIGLDQPPVDGPGDRAVLGRVRGILLKPSGSLLVTAWDNDMIREIRLGALPTSTVLVPSAGAGPHYNSFPAEQARPMTFSGTVVNAGAQQAVARLQVNVFRDGAAVYSKTSNFKLLAAGEEFLFETGDSLLFSTPGTYLVQSNLIGVSSAVYGSRQEEFVVSDSVLAADDGHAYFYDNIEMSLPDGTGSYGQVFELPVADTLTGFSINAELSGAPFYFSVYAMNGALPGPLVYSSDTVLGAFNAFPFDYYHRLPQSLALPAGNYLFALAQWTPAGSLGMGIDTDRNDQSAWYRSPDENIPDWTPLYEFWGGQSAPVYMLRPVFGTPVMTITGTDEKNYAEIQVQLAPNPVSDWLYVRVDAAASESFVLELCDLSGRVLTHFTAFGGVLSAVDMGGLPAGLYQLRVLGARQVAVRKVVKR